MCSRIVRSSLKEPFKTTAIKRGEMGLKQSKWKEGKQGEMSTLIFKDFHSTHD
jgi:hypothetical protein